MSAPMRNSANCKMPSPLASSTEIRVESTRAHCAIQAGKASKGCPTKWLMTSNFTKTAKAGAETYKMAMKNKDQATELRACATVGVV